MTNIDFEPLLFTARDLKIAINPLLLDRSLLFHYPPPLPPILDIRDTFVFSQDPPAEPWPAIDRAIFNEKLVVDKYSGALLAVVARSGRELILEERDEFEKIRRIRAIAASFELEEVVVKADFRKDCLPVGKFKGLVPADISGDKDGGLDWSDAVKKDVAIFLQESRIDKLVIGREIQQKLGAWVARPDAKEELDFDPVVTKKIPPYEPLSPPILPCPLSPKLSIIPDLKDTLGLVPIPLESDEQIVAQITEQLLQESRPFGSPDSSFFRPPTPPASSPIRKHPPPEVLKIEVPLSPLVVSPKRVRFSSILAASDTLRLPKKVDEDLNAPIPFDNVLREEAAQVKRELEQEQLQGADSTMRVSVPVLDFSLPKTEKKDILAELRNWAKKHRNWPGIRSLEIGLRWAPFSKDARNLPLETLEYDEGLIQGYLLPQKETDEAEAFLWKSTEELALSRGDVDDDELPLEPAEFDCKQVLKDSAHIKDIVKRQAKRKTISSIDSATKEKVKKSKKLTREMEATVDHFSAGDSLSSFLNLRGRKALDNPSTPKATMPSKALASKVRSPIPPLPVRKAVSKTTKAPPEISHAVSSMPQANLTVPTTVLASTTLHTSAPFLLRHIRALYPLASIYERDFSTLVTSVGDSIFCTKSSSEEADIIVSPSTGLIYTTLTDLRQRPLPGQATIYGAGETIKVRLVQLSPRYERLIVVVRQHNGNLSGDDAKVLAGFSAFAMGLNKQCTVFVRPVLGDDETVTRHILSDIATERDIWIANSKAAGVKTKLMEEETTWEIMLRKMGLNAMAAQIIIAAKGRLKGFLGMDIEEAGRVWGPIIGGRVIERVMSLVATRWGEGMGSNEWDGSEWPDYLGCNEKYLRLD